MRIINFSGGSTVPEWKINCHRQCTRGKKEDEGSGARWGRAFDHADIDGASYSSVGTGLAQHNRAAGGWEPGEEEKCRG